MANYRIISVLGDSVRIAFGCATIDFRVLIRSDGSKYLERPSNLFVHRHLFNELVRDAFKAIEDHKFHERP
jgi:hypothetical protein